MASSCQPIRSLVQLVNSVTQSCPNLCDPWTAASQASLSITNTWSLLKLMSIESVMPPNHLILFHPCLLLPSIFPSIRVFFPMSQLFVSGGQRIGALASVLLMNIQDVFPLGLTHLISLQSKELSRVFSNLAFVKRLRKRASDNIIWVLQQRIQGRGLFQKGPIGSCWVTFPGI